MRRLYRLTVTLLRDWTRNREAVFFALLFPLILLVIFSLVFAGGSTEFDVAVQNNDIDTEGEPTALSAELVDAVEEVDPLAVHHVDANVSLEREDIEEVTGYKRVLVVPAGFGQRVRNESGRVRATVIRGTLARFNVSEAQQAEAIAGLDALGPENGTAGPARLRLLTVPDDEGSGAVGSILDSVVATFNNRAIGIEEPTATVTTEERGDAALGAVDYFLPAFIVAMVLINGVMTVPSAVADFKRDGTLKRLAATPLRKREWILANVIQQSILAVAIALVMVAVAWLLFGVTAVPGPLALCLLVLGAVAFTALGMVVGGTIRDPGSAVSLGGAIALPLLFISGVFWELDLMPPTLQRVAEFSPVTHFHRSLRELMILDSTTGVAATAAMLAALAVVFLAGAVAVTDWQEFD
ncbi:ABC-2 type transport system permease protein [Halovenus aranensis]|uniref:ABC-2 type transport system permease protein n=1 Tax=Halovenus aranensis TaxID=890420 RepID=A0A1G8XF88_9EURY|nr:ABC transporter permease [Halovenus aranensis]SDJ89086.1 ABC-2 type transport system permease protein [Halovenus aranensis]